MTGIHTTVRIETPDPPTLAVTAACLAALSTLADASFAFIYGSELDSAPEPEIREIRAGSLVVDLVTAVADERVMEALGVFGSLLTAAPWLAGLPHRVREHWYRHAALAEEARIAYEELRTLGTVQVAHEQVHASTARRGRRDPARATRSRRTQR